MKFSSKYLNILDFLGWLNYSNDNNRNDNYVIFNSFKTFHTIHRNLCDEWIVPSHILSQIEAFTCLMYGYPKEKSVDAVRMIMLKKMIGDDDTLTTKSRVDLSRLPPCRDNLVPHVYRVNQ